MRSRGSDEEQQDCRCRARAVIPESIESRLETRDEFSVDIVSTGDSALRSIGAFVPDALLRLEAMLPGLDASEPCRLIRSRELSARLPVVMLGSRSNGVRPMDAGVGLEESGLLKRLDHPQLRAKPKLYVTGCRIETVAGFGYRFNESPERTGTRWGSSS